ncbi:MAG: transporter substrate-binding domain-containing protein, partial [Gammaproteobacteria bacterium]
PPIDFVDKSGQHAGIAADYLSLLEKRLGVKFIPRVSPKFKDMLEKVMQGSLPVGSTISFKKDRAEKLLFTQPFFEVQKVIITRDDSAKITDIKNLYGKTVAIEDGFLTMKLLQEHHPEIKLLPFDSTLTALQKVSWGEADAYVGNQAVADWLKRENQLTNLRIVADAGLGTGPQNFAISKTNPEWAPLRDIIDKTLNAVTLAEHQRIERRWLSGQEESEPDKLELTDEEKRWISENPVIRVGGESNWPPFDRTAENGKWVGITPDYLSLVVNRLGLKVELVTEPSWSEKLELLRDRKLDMMGSMSYTEERAEYLSFTGPYFTSPYVIVTRKAVESISGLKSLNNKTVAMEKDYFLTGKLQKDYKKINLFLVGQTIEALKAVSDGRADAYIGNRAVVAYLMEKE